MQVCSTYSSDLGGCCLSMRKTLSYANIEASTINVVHEDGGNVNKYSGIMNNVNQVLGGDGAQVGFDGKKDVDRVHGDERISVTSCVSSDSLSRPLGFEKRVDDPGADSVETIGDKKM
ncbi:hypothetical protein L1887_34772 [Cichorium endivia]|nr:hypothetical protein L1887_34772 [Cichorium endivia]